MPLPNPFYIDAEALHQASVLRTLAYASVEGQEGILHQTALACTDLDTPGDAIVVAPGPYAVRARHTGGDFETYIGKILAAETVTVNPVGSSGSRTDLVVLRIENPYVSEPTTWPQPPDALLGPYAHIRVVEGVPANTNHVSAHNNTWSAITLARITRPANTGIVTQGHITDLRSLAKLGETRVVIVDSPPSTAPPIEQAYWTESTPLADNTELLSTQLTFTNYPPSAQWQVPIPAWATGMDINVLLNPKITNHVWGEMRLTVQDDAAVGSVPTEYDVNFPTGAPGPLRQVFMIGGTESLSPTVRGKIKTFRLQARSKNAGAHPGKLICDRGTRVNIWINFKRHPVYSD